MLFRSLSRIERLERRMGVGGADGAVAPAAQAAAPAPAPAAKAAAPKAAAPAPAPEPTPVPDINVPGPDLEPEPDAAAEPAAVLVALDSRGRLIGIAAHPISVPLYFEASVAGGTTVGFARRAAASLTAEVRVEAMRVPSGWSVTESKTHRNTI